MSRTTRSLSETLRNLPEKKFWTRKGKPDYKGLFIEVICSNAMIDPGMPVSLDEIRDQMPNLSSFQRSVAREASRRREKKAKKSSKDKEGA